MGLKFKLWTFKTILWWSETWKWKKVDESGWKWNYKQNTNTNEIRHAGHIVRWGKAADGTGKTLLSSTPGKKKTDPRWFFFQDGLRFPFSLHYRLRGSVGSWKVQKVDRVAKCQIFYTHKNLSSKFTPKTRNSRLICFRDKMRKSWSIQVVVGLVCYVRCPIGYLQRICVECKCAWVEITPLKYRI